MPTSTIHGAILIVGFVIRMQTPHGRLMNRSWIGHEGIRTRSRARHERHGAIGSARVSALQHRSSGRIAAFFAMPASAPARDRRTGDHDAMGRQAPQTLEQDGVAIQPVARPPARHIRLFLRGKSGARSRPGRAAANAGRVMATPSASAVRRIEWQRGDENGRLTIRSRRHPA